MLWNVTLLNSLFDLHLSVIYNSIFTARKGLSVSEDGVDTSCIGLADMSGSCLHDKPTSFWQLLCTWELSRLLRSHIKSNKSNIPYASTDWQVDILRNPLVYNSNLTDYVIFLCTAL